MSLSSAEINALVDDFVFEEDSSSAPARQEQIFAELGEKAYPRALQILRDPALKDRLTAVEDSTQEAPINRLCTILDQETPPPAEAAELLSPFLDCESDDIRKDVAMTIGSIGSAEAIPGLRRALADENEYVRGRALMGIEEAVEGSRIDASSVSAIFELVAGMWPEDTSYSVCGDIPLILLRLDQERGKELLLGEEFFTVRFEPVVWILSAFSRESIEIPRTRLLVLIDEAQQEPVEYPKDTILGEALPLLGAMQNPEDLELLDHFLDHENDEVSLAAMKAHYRFQRYYEEIRNPWEIVDSDGWDALTAAEKIICAIECLDEEVKNGGFHQYYFNSSGDYWQDAESGLAEIGAEEHHRVIQETLAQFPDAQPAADQDLRQKQLSKIAREQELPFDELDYEWYAIEDENLDRLLFEFNLANLEGRRKHDLTEPQQPG